MVEESVEKKATEIIAKNKGTRRSAEKCVLRGKIIEKSCRNRRICIFSISTRIRVLLFCFCALQGPAAFAETLQLPEQKPVVSFSLPDSWKPSQTDAGLEAASVDGEIYLSIEYIDADSVNDVIDGAISTRRKNAIGQFTSR
jgi:hypothetical protein